MGRSRGPGVALAWVQTSGVGAPPGPPVHEHCCFFASPGWPSAKEDFFSPPNFLFELEIQGGAQVGRGPETAFLYLLGVA